MLKKFFTLIIVAVLFTATSFSQNYQKPKNIILLIGDGFGLSQVSASIISSNDNPLTEFKSIGLVNTSSADNLITDSAAGATALATGYKTKNGRLCIDENGNIIENIIEVAQKKKMSTGVIATSSITNATPAAFLSHKLNRKEEFEIAEQIINSNVDILFGAETDFFLPSNLGGKRNDSKNLIDSLINHGYDFIKTPDELLTKSITKKSFGLFGQYALPHANKRNYSLGLLTKSAINYLSKNKNGFFLMIEGSQIDWAAEKNDDEYLFSEINDFLTAIDEALKFAKQNQNTLVIITADHDTGSAGITDYDSDKKQIKLTWATNHHTANFVGIFSYGPSANLFTGFLNNYEIGRKLIKLIDPSKKF